MTSLLLPAHLVKIPFVRAARLVAALILTVPWVLPAAEAEPKDDLEFAYRVLTRAMKEGRYEDGLALSRLAMALEPNNPAHAYNAACCEARRGRTGPALDHLERALKLGFSDAAHLKTDEDLASLRKEPRFQRALAALENPPPADARAETELRDLAGRWISQSIRNDYDNGAFDRGAGEDYTPLFILNNGTWRYGTQSGKVTISDASPADLAFMDFKPTAKPENLPKRKFELQGWSGDRAMGYWRIDPSDGKPYRVVLHFRIREPRPGLATWIRSRSSN
jgi:tetratricopeptide (TPR) repeat protein